MGHAAALCRPAHSFTRREASRGVGWGLALSQALGSVRPTGLCTYMLLSHLPMRNTNIPDPVCFVSMQYTNPSEFASNVVNIKFSGARFMASDVESLLEFSRGDDRGCAYGGLRDAFEILV